MTTHHFHVGQCVAGIYLTDKGTTVDYSGVVEKVEPRRSGPASLTIRYASGAVHVTLGHTDFVSSMEPAYRLAALFLQRAPGAEATKEAFHVAVRDWPEAPGFFDIQRAVWVLEHARESIR